MEFGKSTLTRHTSLHTQVGTSGYQAPEILKLVPTEKQNQYDAKCDVWSLGCLLFQSLTSSVPFPSIGALANYCTNSSLFPGQQIHSVGASQDALDFFRYLLQPKPQERPTAEEAFEFGNRWFTSKRDSFVPNNVDEEAAPLEQTNIEVTHATSIPSNLKSDPLPPSAGICKLKEPKDVLDQVREHSAHPLIGDRHDTDEGLILLQDQGQIESASVLSDSGIGSSFKQYTEFAISKDSLPSDSGVGSSIKSSNHTSHPPAPKVAMEVALPSDRPNLQPDDIERLKPSRKDIGSRKGSNGSTTIKAAEAQLFACLSQNSQFMTGVTGLRLSLTTPDARFELTEHLKFFFEDLSESAASRLDHACVNLLRNHWSRERIAGMLIEDGNDNGSENDNDQEQRKAFSKSRRDLNDWLDANLAFMQQHTIPLIPSTEDDAEDLVETLTLEDVKSHEDIDEESAEIFQGIPDYIGQMEAFILNGEPFRKLLQKLYSQNIRVKYLWLRDVLWTIPDDQIDINLQDNASISDRMKHLLERATGVQWEWWPHRPPRIPLYDGNRRITWNCVGLSTLAKVETDSCTVLRLSPL